MTRREFPVKVRAAAAARAQGHCEACGVKLLTGGFHYDHIVPDGLGGEPTLENRAVLCRRCHQAKTTTEDTPRMTKADNQRKRVSQNIKRLSRPLPGGRDSPIKIRMDGSIVDRRTGEPRGK